MYTLCILRDFCYLICYYGWLQAFQQFCIYVNDRLITSADVQLDASYRPTILTSEQTVLVLEASAMPVCYLC